LHVGENRLLHVKNEQTVKRNRMMVLIELFVYTTLTVVNLQKKYNWIRIL